MPLSYGSTTKVSLKKVTLTEILLFFISGGGRIPSSMISPVQQEKRSCLTMSLSQPNLRKPTGLNFSDFTKAATKPAIPLASSNTTGPDIKFPFNLNSQSTGTLKINGEEFVKFSPTTANIQMTLNLELLRKWAFNQNGFVPLLTFYFLKKNFKVEVMELSHGQCLRQLLEYFDIPLLQLRNDYHEESCKLQLNNAAAASGSSVLFKVTNESILKNAVADDYLPEDLEICIFKAFLMYLFTKYFLNC